MKRSNDRNNSLVSRSEKISKLDKTSPTCLLDLLHDDELRRIFVYLDLENKNNLKLTSKTNEKRVMRLDSSMRLWKVTFNHKIVDWEELGLTLSKARVRHLLDGTLESIKLAVEFYHPNIKETYFSIQFLTDSLINHWKNNIVHLGIKISGVEFFFLDPELKMPQLKSLLLDHWEPWTIPNYKENHHGRETSGIVHALLEKHKDTLEKLEIRHLDFTPVPLKLKEFSAFTISLGNMISMLKMSQATLETFECKYMKEISKEEITQVKDLKLRLKQLKVCCIRPQLAALLIKSSDSTLNEVELSYMYSNIEPEEFDLGNIKLNLTSFVAELLSIEILIAVLKVSQKCLENFRIEDCNYDEDDTSLFEGITQLKLKSFTGVNLSSRSLSFVLSSSSTTLEDLNVRSVNEHLDEFDLEDDEELYSGQEFKKLKNFSSVASSAKLSASFINAAHSSLETIELKSLRGEGFELDQDRLQLKNFKGEDIPASVVELVVSSSHASLTHLELNNIRITDEGPFCLIPVKIGLKTLLCSEVSASIAATIINSSKTSLDCLELKNICMQQDNGGFNLDSVCLKIKSFTGRKIPTSLVSMILKHSSTFFNKIELKEIGLKDINQFDSETTKVLIQVKFQNPFCLFNI